MQESNRTPAILLNNVWVGYQKETWVLRGISLSVKQGEAVLLTGPNGSGKTTLIRLLASLIPHVYHAYVRGEVRVCGIDPIADPDTVVRSVGYVGHEPDAQILMPTVFDEIAFAQLLSGVREPRVIEQRLTESLARVEGSALRQRATHELSGGEIAKVVLAANLARQPPLLLLDEPTAFLDKESTEAFLHTLATLREAGHTLVIASQHVRLYQKLVDRVIYIVDGRVDKRGEQRTSVVKEREPPAVRPCETPMEETPIVAVRNVWYRYPRSSSYALRGVSLRLHAGLYVVLGPNGSGKTTLLKLIAGIYSPTKGSVRSQGSPLYLPQDPRLFFTHETLKAEIEAVHKSFDKEAGRVVDQMGLTPFLTTPVHHLSYGLQRRAAIAVGLLGGFNPLLIDEPTAGVDPSGVEALLQILARIRERCIVVATHDQQLVERLGIPTERQIRMENGRVLA